MALEECNMEDGLVFSFVMFLLYTSQVTSIIRNILPQ